VAGLGAGLQHGRWLRLLALPAALATYRGKRRRLAFLNVAARVVRTGRRVHLRLPGAYAQIWQTAKGTTRADATSGTCRDGGEASAGGARREDELDRRGRGPSMGGPWNRPARLLGRVNPRAVRPNRSPHHRSFRCPESSANRQSETSKPDRGPRGRVVAGQRARVGPTTASLALIALNQVCKFALRRGWLADNPVARLESGENHLGDPRRYGC
jgi:hypothetical protein